MSELADYARHFDVLIGIQYHGDFLKTADETIGLLSAVNWKWLGVVIDTGYFLTPDPYVDIAKALPYGVNFQIKEMTRICPSEYMSPPLVATDLHRLMRIISDSEYQGYLPIETLSAGKAARHEPLKVAPKFRSQVRNAINEVA